MTPNFNLNLNGGVISTIHPIALTEDSHGVGPLPGQTHQLLLILSVSEREHYRRALSGLEQQV